MAFPSPPARRSIARHGHPRNTNAPMAAIMPRTKRTMGAEPPRGLNSRVAMAAASEPSTSPMISGRRYWTMAARCRPSPPATSRSKHATQIPMFAGLPSFCSHTAIRPMTAPTTMMPGVVAKRFFLISYSFPNVLADTPCVRWLHPERGKRRNAFTASPRLHTQKGGERLHALSASEQTMRTSHRGFCLSSISCAYTALVHHP